MDVQYSDFLDDTSSSQVTKSPAKTSTVAKEDIKWNEDIFFKRQGLPHVSESLFITPAESPISSTNEPVNGRETLPKPVFDLSSSSFISDKANSSLGILNIESCSGLSDCSFQSIKKQKQKKKLERKPRIASEENFSAVENTNIEEILSAATKDILESLEKCNTEESTDAGSNSSSDIEYDGTNIPELNMDCDILSLIRSDKKKASFIEGSSLSKSDKYRDVKSATFSKKEKSLLESSSTCSEFSKSKLSDFNYGESAENTRNSIFNNFRPSYASLYEQIVPEQKIDSRKNKEKVPKTIKVNPFLDISSFEIEPMLQKSRETTVSSSIENTRCNQELSVDFCPEQISARSSSFRSSVKYDSSNSETSTNSNGKSGFNFSEISLTKGDLENEVTSGQEIMLKLMDANLGNLKDKDPGDFPNCDSTVQTENVSENVQRLSNLPLESNILSGNLSGGSITEGENWYSQLGLSESDFFSSDAAKEMLKKDKETFEKEQFPQTNKISGVSNWSPPSQLEVTAPSWFTELNSSQLLNSSRHISIGTLIGARSEKIGTLSNDEERERPYFGAVATTPPKCREMENSSKNSSDEISPNSQDEKHKNIRFSVLSEFLDETSLLDPLNFASKIIEKCIQNNKEKSINLDDKQTNIENSEFRNTPIIVNKSDRNIMGNVKESDTFIRATNSSINRETYDANIECKSSMGESDGSTLNYSMQSSSERGSIKTTKSDDASTSCNLPSLNQCTTQEFSRPASVCSSTCSNHISTEKALTLQYGCMKYLSSGVEHNQNGIANSLQASSCPHLCLHTMQPNFLPFNTCNSLQSAIQNAITGSLYLPGSNGIQAPSELKFPEKIALGDSQEMNLTVRNSANIAYYRISYISAYLNDSPLPDGMCGLNVCNFIPCNVGKATDIKLIIAPKYEGNFEVNIQVDAFMDCIGQTLNATPSASVKIKIYYTVVRPCISILYKGKSCLNLGTVITGSSFVEYVTVINNCEVAVPLRISLSNDNTENQIYFGLKEMDRQKHPSSSALRFLSPTILLYRIPASKNKSIPSSLDIPVVFESISSPVSSSISAAIETPTVCETLGYIKILAVVGNARLILKDSDQNPLILKASKGATCSHSVTVMNDGSVSVVYDIHIDGADDVLFVSPNSLNMQPKQCTTISVTFMPQTYDTVKGNLLAAAEPHGQVFILTEIIGHVKESYSLRPQSNNPHTHNTRPTRDSGDFINESSSQIECDKKYLAWGGIEIGSIVLKTYTVRNPLEEAVQVKVFLKDKDKGFMLMDESSQKTLKYMVTVNARDSKVLSVIFSPSDVKSYSTFLYIKPQNGSKVFTIPLTGYGGTSNLKILNLSLGEGTDYCMDIDAGIDTENLHKNIILHNSGLRPAFVKLYAISDNLIENLTSQRIFINPSEFVLLEKEKKNVSISVKDIQRKQISKTEVINIVYGDEILRQSLKRVSKSRSFAFGKAYENFTAYFHGEEKVDFDSTYIPSPKDETLFHTNLNKIKIHVFFNGQNTSFSRTSFGPLAEIQDNFSNTTFDSTLTNSNSSISSKLRRLTIESHSPPVKDSTVHNANRLSLPIPFSDNLANFLSTDDIYQSTKLNDELNNVKLNTWTVYPEKLIIDADNKERRILLKSDFNSDLRFKVECTIDVIIISPLSGTLSAKGEIGLRLTLITTNHNKLLEDYHGNIKICCDGTEKNVSVIVLKDKKIKSSSPSPPGLNDSLRSGFLGESDLLENTVVESTSKSLSIENIFKFPKVIDLTAKVGALSETVLVVSNPTKETVTWNICPMSLMFSKPSDDSIDCTDSPIEFETFSGVIKSMSTENIVIKFFPRRAASFQQFFKLTLNLKSGMNQTYNIKVQGKAEPGLSFTLSYSDTADKNKNNSIVKRKANSVLFTESDICKFPVTDSGQKSSEGIIVKNVSYQDFTLSIIKPQLPFKVSISSCIVKSKRFYRIPVRFKPLKPGKFESEITFIYENKKELKVKLIGLCTA